MNPVTFKWKWGDDELRISDQYTYLGVEISEQCSWDAHIAKVIGKGEAYVCNMDAILTDSHLDTRIKRCILINVIVPKLEYAGKQLETVQITPVKKVLRCSSTTSKQYQDQSWECTQLEQKEDVTKLKRQYKVRSMPKKSLPAIADRPVWEKLTKRASWNKVG